MKKLLLIIGFIYIVCSFQISHGYTSQNAISKKTTILMSKYPKVQTRVDEVLGGFYKRIGEYPIDFQQKIYIRLQERVNEFKEKYSDNQQATLLLDYIYESIAVQIFLIKQQTVAEEQRVIEEAKKIEEAKNKTTTTNTVTQTTSNTIKKSTTSENTNSQSNTSSDENRGDQNDQQNDEDDNGDDSNASSNSGSTDVIPVIVGSGSIIPGDEIAESAGVTSDDEEIFEEVPTEESGIDIFEEESQTAIANELGRFINNVSVDIESVIFDVVGDRDFIFADNTLYIKDESGNIITESNNFIIIGGNHYSFIFESFTLPEGIIVFETNEFSISDDAATEIHVPQISIPTNIEVENLYIGQALALKDRIDLLGGEAPIDGSTIVDEEIPETDTSGSGSTGDEEESQ